MANYLTNDTDLAAVADAIRNKGGTSAALEYPDGFVSAIGDISGGGKEDVEWHQCKKYARSFVNQVTYNPNDYSYSDIDSYIPEDGTLRIAQTKPQGETIDGVTYYNEIPNVKTPFATANKAGTLKPLDQVRWINSQTINTRDLGGWACDGGTVKYGMLFRGGEANVNDKDLMVNQIGIKHELQLRGTSEEPQAYSLWGIPFSHTTNYVWLSVADSTRPTWKEIFDCVFSTVPKGIPLYFHCAAGADRTGTLAVMLEALLGVSQSDIDKDYELTNFHTGTGTEATARKRNEDEYKNYIRDIKLVPLVGGLTDTFRNRAVSFVLSLGYTIDQINAFRKACINGTPTDITVSMDTYSITKTLTHVSLDNTATSVDEFQGYEANVTPDAGYVISDVKIKMGGVDVTSQYFKGEKTNLNRSIAKTLSHCTINNSKESVIDGQSYGCVITPDAGCTMDGGTVQVLMGGTDVTNQVYFGGGSS